MMLFCVTTNSAIMLDYTCKYKVSSLLCIKKLICVKLYNFIL